MISISKKVLIVLHNSYNCFYKREMSDNFRVAECLHTPSQLFCIYDYTKIAYITGNYICVREVVNPDSRPTFIKLDSGNIEADYQKYIELVSYPNLLILAQKSQTKDIYIHFFSANEERQLKVLSQLARRADSNQEISYQIHKSPNYLYVVAHRDNDSEIIAIDIVKREVSARGFISGQIQQFKIKNIENSEQFSLFHPDSKEIVEYELISSKTEDHGLRIAEKNRWNVCWNKVIMGWQKEQMLVAHQKQLKIFLEGKQIQMLEGPRPIKMIIALSEGFMAVAGNGMRIYRKSASVYELEGEYSFQQTPTSSIHLSPQEDFMAFYSKSTKTIYWSVNWQVHESSKKYHEISCFKIQMPKEDEIKAYPSNQALFAVSSGSCLSIYSPITYNCYLSMKANIRQGYKVPQKRRLLRSTTMVSDKLLTQISEGEPIETIGIHPTKPLMAIAYKKSIRIYMVLYNELKLLKQLTLAHCKVLGFNNSGSIMYAKLGGRQGSKIYLYNTHSQYQCIEILNTNRPVIDIKWTLFDTAVYAVYSGGYYTWTLDSFFKHKYDSTHHFNFEILGSAMLTSSIIFWGNKHILQFDFNNNVLDSFGLNNPINQLLVQKGHLIFTSVSGDLYRCKTLSQMEVTLTVPGFKIQPLSNIYGVRDATILSLNKDGNIMCLEWGTDQKLSLQTVAIQRKKLIRFQQAYKSYEQQIKEIRQTMQTRLQILRQQFSRRQKEQQLYFSKEISDREDRYRAIREEKFRIEEQMQENMEIHEEQVLKQIKELERIYERKLALSTNKILTSQQIAFRNNMLAKQNLIQLEEKHSENINEVRKQYGKALEQEVMSKAGAKNELLVMKKEYETRLAELEQENEELLKRFQNLNEANVINLKKNVVNLELKYSEAVSQKFNLEKSVENQRILLQQVNAKNSYLSDRLQQEIRRCEQLSLENKKMQDHLIQKDETITCLQARITQLQKSNQIFKYRIIQIKNMSDPKEQQILKLKDNMIELEQEYEKITKKAHQFEQNITILRKDNNQLKNSLTNITNKEKRLDKNYSSLTDRLRQITKSPIQQIRKGLMKLLEQFERHGDSNNAVTDTYNDGPLEELNRVRGHLEICLKEAVDTGKKNEKQKETQVKRKNKENSQLLKQINDLRIKIFNLEGTLKQRDLELQEYRRERKNSSASKPARERSSTHVDTELQRNHTRESFFERSLFRGHWKEKRLRTEHGSRKKSNQSRMRNETNHLYIQSKQQEVQELKRVLEQKEVIIKQLINKIHKLS